MKPINPAETAEFVIPESNAVPPPASSSARVQVDLAGLSHQGLIRPNNEDHFLISRFGRFLERLQTNMPEAEIPQRGEEIGYAMVVADGIGGAVAGEQASKLAISALVRLVLDFPDWILRLDETLLSQTVLKRARDRFDQIQDIMEERAHADPSLDGFGTTMTLAWSIGRDLFVGHLGDSRAYLYRRDHLIQLTRDHTLAQELADRGQIAQEEVARHRLRHMLTRALGTGSAAAAPDVQKLTLKDGDCLLVCSDGLTNMVPDEDIARVLHAGDSAERTCQRLIERALAGGGKDNITAVVGRYRFPE